MRIRALWMMVAVVLGLQVPMCEASGTTDRSVGLSARVSELVPLGDLSESRSSGAAVGLKLVLTYFQAGLHFASLGRPSGGDTDNVLILDAGLRLPLSDAFALSAGGGYWQSAEGAETDWDLQLGADMVFPSPHSWAPVP